jgi:hypothetical protein
MGFDQLKRREFVTLLGSSRSSHRNSDEPRKSRPPLGHSRAYMPDAAWAVSVHPPKLIPEEGSPPGFDIV